MASVLLPRTCRACGTVFVGGPRAWYCPDCRAERTSCAYEGAREVDRPASIAWNQAHKDTYYPEKNAKRRKNPDAI